MNEVHASPIQWVMAGAMYFIFYAYEYWYITALVIFTIIIFIFVAQTNKPRGN